MGFLGKALGTGLKFLGHAQRGAAFLGKALPHAAAGLQAAQRFTSNPAVQQAGAKLGLGPNVFARVNAIGDTTRNAIGLIPGLANNARDVAAGLQTAVTDAGRSLAPARRSIADLYRQANA